MMAELGENAPVYSLLPKIKNYQIEQKDTRCMYVSSLSPYNGRQASVHCVIPFGFRKGKTENLSYQFRAIYSFMINLLNTRDRKNPIYFYCGPWFEVE